MELSRLAQVATKPSLLGVALATLGAFSIAIGNAQAVQIPGDGYGQVLLAPLYDVFDGMDNVVRVVNSSLTDAVKTKLVLRSAVDGRECFSTILYLTPGDVAKLTISPDPATRFGATLTSTDDSLLSQISADGVPIFASIGNLRTKTSSADLFRPASAIVNGRPNGDHCAIGSIEVIGAYAVRDSIHTPTGNVAVKNGMTKGDLYKIFSIGRTALNNLNPANPPRSTIWDANWGRIALLGSVDVTWKEATRQPHIRIPMTALASSADAYLIANEFFDVTVGAQTNIGQGWGVGGLENLPAIEAALNASALQAQYENDAAQQTNLIVTFPTKYRHLVSKSSVDYTRAFGRPSPFNTDGTVVYDTVSFDMFENGVVIECCAGDMCNCTTKSYITDGANYIFSGWFGQFFDAEEGWFSFDLVGPNPPIAAIAYTHHISNGDYATSFVLPMARK